MTSNEGLRMLCSKAEIIDEIDTMLPRYPCGGISLEAVRTVPLPCATPSGAVGLPTTQAPLSHNNPSRFVEKQFPQFYPKYLHILRVDPDKIDKVEKATVWGARQDDVEGGGRRRWLHGDVC